MGRYLIAPLINYTFSETPDGEQILEIVTKIPNPLLSAGHVDLEIDTTDARISCVCTWFCTFSAPGIEKYSYRVERREDRAAERMTRENEDLS